VAALRAVAPLPSPDAAQPDLRGQTLVRYLGPVAAAAFDDADVARLLGDVGIVRNRQKIAAVIANAQTIQGLRRTHGSFACWLAAHHPLPLDEWTRLFRRTFRFTGGLIVHEFLMSLGYLPGAHVPDCPIYSRVLPLAPPWSRVASAMASGSLRA
jgi:3-methyladenine DNA glycosylase Tag